jgi:hypothetical protein
VVPPPDPSLSGGAGNNYVEPAAPPPQTLQTLEPFRYAMFNNLPFNYSTIPELALSSTAAVRVYLMLVNLSTSQFVWVSFGTSINLDGLSNTVPGAIPLPPNYGFLLLDNCVPQNDIYVTGDGNGQMTIAYANMMQLNIQPQRSGNIAPPSGTNRLEEAQRNAYYANEGSGYNAKHGITSFEMQQQINAGLIQKPR